MQFAFNINSYSAIIRVSFAVAVEKVALCRVVILVSLFVIFHRRHEMVDTNL